jgi:hypothetical protein
MQFCAIDPHEGRNAMYSLSTKVEYATDITLGKIGRLKSYRVHKRCKKILWFTYYGAFQFHPVYHKQVHLLHF